MPLRALDIVDADDAGLDLVADVDHVLDLEGAVVGELGDGDVSGVLGAHINGDFGGRDGDNITGNSVSVIYHSDGIFQQFIKRLLGVGLDGGFLLSRGLGFYGSGLCGGGLFDRGRSDILCSGLFHNDFVAHFFYYLLYDPRRHRSAGRDADQSGACESGTVQLFGVGNKNDLPTVFAAKLREMETVGAVRASDHDHGVAYGGQPDRFSLTVGSCSTYSIK